MEQRLRHKIASHPSQGQWPRLGRHGLYRNLEENVSISRLSFFLTGQDNTGRSLRPQNQQHNMEISSFYVENPSDAALQTIAASPHQSRSVLYCSYERALNDFRLDITALPQLSRCNSPAAHDATFTLVRYTRTSSHFPLTKSFHAIVCRSRARHDKTSTEDLEQQKFQEST
jgi:hypothetical protein